MMASDAGILVSRIDSRQLPVTGHLTVEHEFDLFCRRQSPFLCQCLGLAVQQAY